MYRIQYVVLDRTGQPWRTRRVKQTGAPSLSAPGKPPWPASKPTLIPLCPTMSNEFRCAMRHHGASKVPVARFMSRSPASVVTAWREASRAFCKIALGVRHRCSAVLHSSTKGRADAATVSSAHRLNSRIGLCVAFTVSTAGPISSFCDDDLPLPERRRTAGPVDRWIMATIRRIELRRQANEHRFMYIPQ
jgi:hypothetical protein